MRYGVITGRVDRDPCTDLHGALTPVKTKNHAAITDPIKVGELLRAIDGYQCQPSTAPAFFIVDGVLPKNWTTLGLAAFPANLRLRAKRAGFADKSAKFCSPHRTSSRPALAQASIKLNFESAPFLIHIALFL
jgi:hypothetical protein